MLDIDFTQKHVRVGGKKYPRIDRGVPLSVECRIDRDTEAEKELATHEYSRKRAHEFGQSRSLTLVIRHVATSGLDDVLPTGGGRVVELGKIIGEQQAKDFVIVCQQALAYTTPQRPNASASGSTRPGSSDV